MKILKNILGGSLVFAFFGVLFAQVDLVPVYSSERFQPADKFHAGCENQIDVTFSLDNSKIDGVNAILEYDGSKVDIIKILPQGEKENNLTYTVEDDKIIFSKLKTEAALDKVIFSILFKVDESMEISNFSFSKGSYIVDDGGNMVELDGNYEFQFAEVPECDPDIVAPNIELLFPNEDQKKIALDSYFQFKLSDQGKGINKGSLVFSIDGVECNSNNAEIDRDDETLTVYPNFWLPFDSKVEVEISISDKQVYGNENTTTKSFDFDTADELYLLSDISPIEYRKLLDVKKYFKGTEDECSIINFVYQELSDADQDILVGINDKLDCEELVLNGSDKNGNIENIGEEQNKSKYSVFAIMGRILSGGLFLFIIFSKLNNIGKVDK